MQHGLQFGILIPWVVYMRVCDLHLSCCTWSLRLMSSKFDSNLKRFEYTSVARMMNQLDAGFFTANSHQVYSRVVPRLAYSKSKIHPRGVIIQDIIRVLQASVNIRHGLSILSISWRVNQRILDLGRLLQSTATALLLLRRLFW